MAELAVLVPSRERPHNIARLVEAMDKTCRADTQLVVGVDADDPTLDAYREFDRKGRHDIQLWTMPSYQRQLVRWLNLMSATYADLSPCVGHIGDDNVPRTVGWDVRIMESLEHNLFCFGDDLDPGRAPGSLSIHIFMRSDVIKRLGYMGPPSIQHMYVDPVWYAWGQATSIEFLEDVVLEHLHYTISGKALIDESYERSTALIPQDCSNYNDYCDDGMNADIGKLGGELFTVEAMAEFNRKLNIPRRWAA